MVVEETITVQATGEEIKRGIYRDFPLTSPFHEDLVPFKVLQVLRDGKATPYWVERRGKSERINIYKEGVYIEPGIYTYSITYRTDKQLDFSNPNTDRLYWNVTGQDWLFAIKKVKTTIHLPADVPTSSLQLKAFTGFMGEKGQSYEAYLNQDEDAEFITIRSLKPREGLRIIVQFPKGVINSPNSVDKFPGGITDLLSDFFKWLENFPFSEFLFFTIFSIIIILNLFRFILPSSRIASIDNNKIHYGTFGRIIQIGNLPVNYGFWGRITSIGDMEVCYGLGGRIIEIGDLPVNYGFWGRITSIGDMEVCYGLGGRIIEIGNLPISYGFWGRVLSIGQMNVNYSNRDRSKINDRARESSSESNNLTHHQIAALVPILLFFIVAGSGGFNDAGGGGGADGGGGGGGGGGA